MFETIKHKSRLKKAFSDCFDPLRGVLGNVPRAMRQDRYINAYILATCRAYAEWHKLKEANFADIVDAVFEELYRQDSIEVQNRTEHWLQGADEIFMRAYYEAKEYYQGQLDLKWLADYSQTHFKKAYEVYHST
jgi:hypothetical protein